MFHEGLEKNMRPDRRSASPDDAPARSDVPHIALLSTSDTDLLSARESGAAFTLGNPSRLDVEADLTALIEAADLDTPLILVGHSYGSQVVRRFDTRYPRLVLALVLVDPPEQNVGAFSPAYARAEAGTAPRLVLDEEFSPRDATTLCLLYGERLFPHRRG